MTGNSAPFYAGVMVATGLGIPVMAALNAGLGQKIGSSSHAAVILFAVALFVTLLAAIASGDRPVPDWSAAPPWYYLGGLFVAAYVLAISAFGPRIGIANAIFLVLLGQLAGAAAVDHFGVFGVARSALTLQRAGGIVLIAIGVLLARKPM